MKDTPSLIGALIGLSVRLLVAVCALLQFGLVLFGHLDHTDNMLHLILGFAMLASLD